MAEKVTIMVLKVDLQCCRCYKKVKKVLCKFPQIRDQIYDQKANTVTITVVSSCPEKIRDKICRKGGRSIECITIKPPPKPEPQETKPPQQKEKKPPPQQETKPLSKSPSTTSKTPVSPKSSPAPPCRTAHPPIRFCCVGCYHGHVWGPCYFGGPPPRPRPCYEICGRPAYDSYGCGCGGGYKYYNVSRGDCLCEENPQKLAQSCSVAYATERIAN